MKHVIDPVRVCRNCDFTGRGRKHGEGNRCWSLNLRNRLRRCGLRSHLRGFRWSRLLLRTRRMGAGINEGKNQQNDHGNQRVRSKCAAASNAIGSMHGDVAKVIFPRERGPEHLYNTTVSRHEMANRTVWRIILQMSLRSLGRLSRFQYLVPAIQRAPTFPAMSSSSNELAETRSVAPSVLVKSAKWQRMVTRRVMLRAAYFWACIHSTYCSICGANQLDSINEVVQA